MPVALCAFSSVVPLTKLSSLPSLSRAICIRQGRQPPPLLPKYTKTSHLSRHVPELLCLTNEVYASNGGNPDSACIDSKAFTTSARSLPDVYIRPTTATNFSILFDDNLVVRPWQRRDRHAAAQVIAGCLTEHGLEWEPGGADIDAIDVDTHYKDGEFWVVEDIRSARVLATAAFRPDPTRGQRVVEIRKMYLHPSVRRRGLGSFLLSALERRAIQRGYATAVVETASALTDAVALYQMRGYTPISDVLTERCDQALQKDLRRPFPPPMEDDVEVVDASRGWTVAYASRRVVSRNRLLFRAVAVLVQTVDGHVLVHRRPFHKKTFPGKWVALVTGYVDWAETPLSTAKREVIEEVGIDKLTFVEPFEPFISIDEPQDGDTSSGQRILFHPYIATGVFSEDDVLCAPDEVECGRLMTREDILNDNIGGSLWAEFRKHAL